MTVDGALHINKILCGLINDDNFAMGGYPALVKQKILKEERETKDIDLVRVGGTGMFDYLLNDRLHSEYLKTLDNWPELLGNISQFNVIGSMLAYSHKSEEDQDNAESVKIQAEKLSELGINKSSSMAISRMSAAEVSKQKDSRKYNATPSGLGGFYDPNLYDYSTIAAGYMSTGGNTYTINTGSTTSYYNPNPSPRSRLDQMSFNTLEAAQALVSQYVPLTTTHINDESSLDEINSMLRLVGDRAYSIRSTMTSVPWNHDAMMFLTKEEGHWRILENDLSKLAEKKKLIETEKIARFMRRESSYNYREISDFFTQNDISTLNIDIFALKKKKSNLILSVNNEKFVHYYLILKAKYEYCRNKATDDKAFEKHIADLEKSFDGKRIWGLNDPKSIDSLIALRLNL